MARVSDDRRLTKRSEAERGDRGRLNLTRERGAGRWSVMRGIRWGGRFQAALMAGLETHADAARDLDIVQRLGIHKARRNRAEIELARADPRDVIAHVSPNRQRLD